jgi:hypothetical protein
MIMHGVLFYESIAFSEMMDKERNFCCRRWNYQMDNDLTWPPHNPETIPTGAYATNYKVAVFLLDL